jgi:hypothetical protein
VLRPQMVSPVVVAGLISSTQNQLRKAPGRNHFELHTAGRTFIRPEDRIESKAKGKADEEVAAELCYLLDPKRLQVPVSVSPGACACACVCAGACAPGPLPLSAPYTVVYSCVCACRDVCSWECVCIYMLCTCVCACVCA